MDVHPDIHGFVDEDLIAAADINITVDNVQYAAVDVDLLADVDVVLAVNNVQDLLYDLKTDILPILLRSVEEI